MKQIYSEIQSAKETGKKLLAILLDPDKIELDKIGALSEKINNSPATHIFIGGSQVFSNSISEIISAIKVYCKHPVILFPGNPSQISNEADGILFLSLLSGRNPDFLIEHQVKAAPMLAKSDMEIIPTGYILVESGNETAVSRISKTDPMLINDPEKISATAQAGELLGKKLIYLEAGSGAKNAVPSEIIRLVSNLIKIPLIVGGGITSKSGIQNAYDSGADLVVIGTAFENDQNFFQNLYTETIILNPIT